MLESLEAFREEVQRAVRSPAGRDRGGASPAGVARSRSPTRGCRSRGWSPRRPAAATSPGWFTEADIHVLSPPALERRASKVPGSREALLLSPLHEYSHLVIGVNNPDLPPRSRPPPSGATCAGRGCARARPCGSPGRRPTCAPRSCGGSARAAARSSRPRRATRCCSAARSSAARARGRTRRGGGARHQPAGGPWRPRRARRGLRPPARGASSATGAPSSTRYHRLLRPRTDAALAAPARRACPRGASWSARAISIEGESPALPLGHAGGGRRGHAEPRRARPPIAARGRAASPRRRRPRRRRSR